MELTGFSAELKARLEEWFRWDKNIDTKAEIEDLVKARDEKELNKRMLTRMEFGTAGQNESEVELSFLKHHFTVFNKQRLKGQNESRIFKYE